MFWKFFTFDKDCSNLLWEIHFSAHINIDYIFCQNYVKKLLKAQLKSLWLNFVGMCLLTTFDKDGLNSFYKILITIKQILILISCKNKIKKKLLELIWLFWQMLIKVENFQLKLLTEYAITSCWKKCQKLTFKTSFLWYLILLSGLTSPQVLIG